MQCENSVAPYLLHRKRESRGESALLADIRVPERGRMVGKSKGASMPAALLYEAAYHRSALPASFKS